MRRTGQDGQAFPLVLALALLILAAGSVVFAVGRAYVAKADAQSAADLVAVGTGRVMRDELIAMAGAWTPVERERWRRRLSAQARDLARVNGVRLERVVFVDGAVWPPTVVRVRVSAVGPMDTVIPAAAQAEVQPGAGTFTDTGGATGGGQYAGPFAYRQGKPMCPQVARVFDQMAAAARRDGVTLVINSAFRSDREQAVLFSRHPDPKWVAPPGRSRHRNATELDIAGTPGAWSWLGANARRFDFMQRYSWEPWHFGYLPGCGRAAARPVAIHTAASTGPDEHSLAEWVPQRYRDVILRSARAGGVPPVVLASLLKAESEFNPRAVSGVGAQGIAQFMPATARAVGLADPFDPDAAIMAAGRLLGSNLREFGSIPLALAAYNAGGGAVHRYGGVPPFAETRAYVAKIMALAGDPSMAASASGGAGDVVLTRIDQLLV